MEMRSSLSLPTSEMSSSSSIFYNYSSSNDDSSKDASEMDVGQDLTEKPSYIGYIEMINEFLENKANQRAAVVNKKRDAFGIYTDCFGLSKKTIFFSEKERGTFSLRYSPDGNWVVAGFGSGTLKLYDAKTYTEKNTVVYGRENGYPVTCIRYMPNNSNVFYVSSAEGFVLSYNIAMDDLTMVVNQGECEINSIDINVSNNRLLTGGSDHGIKVYDIGTSVLLSTYRNLKHSEGRMGYQFSEFHTNRVYAVKFLPDNPFVFLSGGWDNMLKMWDLRVKYGCVKSTRGPHICGDAIDVRGNILLTGSWEAKNSMHVRDLQTLNLIQNVLPSNAPKVLHGIYTYATQFYDSDKEGDVFLHASLGYKSLDVISIKQNIMLHSFVCEQTCFSLDSYGSKIVFGGMHNVFNFAVFYMNILVPFEERPVIVDSSHEVPSEEEEQSEVEDINN